MNIPPRLHPLRGSIVLAVLGALALTAGCVPGQGIDDPDPPGAPTCEATLSCNDCQEHADCASRVCDRDKATCVDESTIAYVAEGGTGDCTLASPCGSIATALDLVRADNDTRRIIRLDRGTYTEQVTLSDVNVRIIGDGDATIQSDGTPPDPAHAPSVVTVSERAQVRLEGVRIQDLDDLDGDASTIGVQCLGDSLSSLRMLQVTVTGNAGLGLLAESCILTVERSAFTGNAGGGILVIDSPFDITNSYILDNGDVTASAVSGVTIRNQARVAPQRFVFNTVAGNRAGPEAPASGVRCDVASTGYIDASSNIVLVGLGGKRSVAGECPWRYSNLEGMSPINPVGFAYEQNVDADCLLSQRQDGLPRITAGTRCDGTGQPGAGIAVDYDGAPRSATAPDMGADEL